LSGLPPTSCFFNSRCKTLSATSPPKSINTQAVSLPPKSMLSAAATDCYTVMANFLKISWKISRIFYYKNLCNSQGISCEAGSKVGQPLLCAPSRLGKPVSTTCLRPLNMMREWASRNNPVGLNTRVPNDTKSWNTTRTLLAYSRSQRSLRELSSSPKEYFHDLGTFADML
jgi:hypothetical protein